MEACVIINTLSFIVPVQSDFSNMLAIICMARKNTDTYLEELRFSSLYVAIEVGITMQNE